MLGLSFCWVDVFLHCANLDIQFLGQWIPELQHHAPGVPLVLVGTKLGKKVVSDLKFLGAFYIILVMDLCFVAQQISSQKFMRVPRLNSILHSPLRMDKGNYTFDIFVCFNLGDESLNSRGICLK